MIFEMTDLKERKGNNNNNRNNNFQKKQNNNKKQQQQQRKRSSYEEQIRNDSFLSCEDERGSGVRTFDDTCEDVESTNIPEEVEKAMDTLDSFLAEYADALSERGNQIPNIISDLFWDVAGVLTHYYENKYKPALDKMNKVLNLCCQQRFASSLASVCRNEDIDGWNDGINDIWKDVMFVISTLLTTSHSMMKDETISTYIDLLSSNGLAGKDINRITKDLGITKDLAIDLTATIPVIPSDMTDVTLRQFYPSFLVKLLQHAEDNIDVMDKVTQGKLFSWFFGKDKIALKAIGRMMATPVVSKFGNDSQKMIYAEYQAMLAEKLDAYEIKDIKYVLEFIVSEKKKAGDAILVFGTVSISEYDSIRKAMFELIKENPEAKAVLITQ